MNPMLDIVAEMKEIDLNYTEEPASPKFDAITTRNKLLEKITKHHILILLIIGMVKGNNITNILLHSKPCLRMRQLEILRQVIDIKDRGTGNPNGLTLSRLQVCFAEECLGILHYLKPTYVKGIRLRQLRWIHPQFPAEARVTAGAALLPKTLSSPDIYKALALFLAPSLLGGEILNKCKRFWMMLQENEKAERTLKFVMRNYHSDVFTTEERKKIALQYNIVINDREQLRLSDEWEAAGAAAIDWLKAFYYFDLPEKCDLGLD